MKIINSYRGGALPEPNTFIGGVGATSVTSMADFVTLANGISVSNISNFSIDSNNHVSFFVDATYAFINNAFQNDSNITYFFDYDGKCTGLNSNVFRTCVLLRVVALYGATSCGSDNFIGSNSNEVIYLPVMVPIGGASTDQGNFSTSFYDFVYVHADIETNNGGSPDGDIASATNISTLSYIANTTKPSDITDLAVVTDAFGSLLQFDWTAPSSSNAIDYYEILVDGHYIGRTTSLNYLLTGLSLNTSYSIEVNAVDIYYNHGSSNTLVLTTNATYNIPTGDIVSYYPLNTNSDDSVGTNDGSDTSMSYVDSGGIGNVADFTAGTSSEISIADDNSLSFGNGTTDSPFSISFLVKWSSVGNTVFYGKVGVIISTLREYQLFLNGTTLFFRKTDESLGGAIDVSLTWIPSSGVWYYITTTDDGTGSSGMNIYINSIKQSVSTGSSGSYTAMENLTAPLLFGKNTPNTTFSLNGYMDEISIFDIELSEVQIIEIKAKNDANLGLTE